MPVSKNSFYCDRLDVIYWVNMAKELPFEPFPYLHNPHQQTIISAFFNLLFEPPSQQKLVVLPDGDKISLEITTPENWKPSDLTVILVHGLCGSHRSANLVRMTERLAPLGIRVVRFNMRSCGSGKGLAKHSFHGGRSEDLFEAIKVLKIEHPESPLILIGFSLGANISLKLAGELNSLGNHFLEKVIAVSPPVDLYSSIRMLGEPANALYERYFYRLLRADVHYRHNKKFKDLTPIRLPKSLKLYEFDQLYTAPQYGFRNAEDYYGKCSSQQFVADIAIPCKILLAEDDPIVAPSALDGIRLPQNVDLFKTKKGGHMGYLGNPNGANGFRWLDGLLLEWITEKRE